MLSKQETPWIDLPNGCGLFVMPCSDTGGRIYYSDEVGGGVQVWHTALVDKTTLLAAIVEEERARIKEYHEKCK